MEHIVLAEVTDNTEWNKFFPFYAHVWLVRTNNDYTGLADPDFELENIGLDNSALIISLQVKKKSYLSVATVGEVILNKETFFFDKTDSTLLIHFEDNRTPYFFKEGEIQIGFVLGFYYSNSKLGNNAEWNNTQYYGRLAPTNLTGTKKDDLYFTKQIFPAKNLKIDNSDFLFNNFNTGANIKRKNGNFTRILIWTGADAKSALYSEFTIDYQGTIEHVTQGKTIDIRLRDIRASLVQKTPVRYLDTSTLTDIKDPTKEYLIPETWGTLFDVPVLCLNENVNDGGGTTAYEFMICDTLNLSISTTAINKVIINGKETSLSPTVTFDTVQRFAKFSIPAIANFRLDDGTGSFRFENMDKVTLNLDGYLKGANFIESDGTVTVSPTDVIKNGLAILREMIRIHDNKAYSNTFFDVSTWQTFEDAAYDVGFLANSQKALQKRIEQLSSWQLGRFIFGTDLKFSFATDSFVTIKDTILRQELLPRDFVPTFKSSIERTLAIYRVGHKIKWNRPSEEGRYEWLVDTSNETDALVKYNSKNSEDFLTGIDNPTQAQDFADRIKDIGGVPIDTFKIRVPWKYIDIVAGDWIKVDANYANNNHIVGIAKCQVLEVRPISSSWTIELTLRIFAYFLILVNDQGEPLTDELGNIQTGEEISI